MTAKIKTNVKAGGVSRNHNERALRGLPIKTGVRGGGNTHQHNESIVCNAKIRTNLKADDAKPGARRAA
jgi:hypothetical protein